MQLVFIGEHYPQDVEKMLFLAGSTLRRSSPGNAWHVDAIQLLGQLGYDGVVYIPEDREGATNTEPLDYEIRAKWIYGALMRSDVTVFWLPEQLESVPNILMGIELGWLMESGRMVLGIAAETEAFLDLQTYAQISHIPRTKQVFVREQFLAKMPHLP